EVEDDADADTVEEVERAAGHENGANGAGRRRRDDGLDDFDDLPSGMGEMAVMYHSLDAMQSVLVRYRLAGYPPDVLITVPRDACRSLEFHRAEEMIALGRDLAERELDRAGP